MSNLAQAQLSALGYGPTDTVFFRAIGPNGARKLDGTLVHQLDELQTLNSEGYGIYFVVNGGGHADANVKTGRATFYEHDDLDKPIQIDLWQTLGLPEPTFQIDTGGKSIHSYWVLNHPMPIADWKVLQKDLLEFANADRSIKNPSRVMRLAGFNHQKTGRESVIVSNGGTRYKFEELRSMVTVPEPAPKKKSSPVVTLSCADDDLAKILARDILSRLSAEQIFNWSGHDFKNEADDKLKGHCPWHDSQSGTSFWVTSSQDGVTYTGACPSCTGNEKMNAVAYRFALRRGGPSGQPTGRDFVDIVRELADDAGVTIPEKTDCPIKSLTAETVGNWDLTDVPDGEISSKTMIAMRSVKRAVGTNLRLNELTNSIEFFGKPLDPNMSKLFVAKLVDVDRPEGDCTIILSAIAKKNAYHPVKIWLEKLHQTHGKSTIDYLNRPASRYLHTNNLLYDKMLQLQLIAAVKRIYEPGSKFDNAVILQGAQGIGKSTFWNTIAGDEWFDDNLGADVENKDELMKLHRTWFEEWGEIDRITGKKEIGAVKSFLSRRVDTFRAPYERTAIEHPRRGVIVGSVNPDQFLRDDENRRFWIIPVAQKIDIEAVKLDRDLIWAAAVAHYKMGTQIYLSAEEEELLRDSNSQFAVRDVWEDTIETWINSAANTIVKPGDDTEWVCIEDVLINCLGMSDVSRHSQLDKKRIQDVLRRSGFSPCKNTVRLPGYATPKRAWFRQITAQIPIAPPSSEPSTSLVVPIPVVTPARQSNLGTWDDDDSTADIVENYEYFDNPDVIEMSDRQRAVIGVAA